MCSLKLRFPNRLTLPPLYAQSELTNETIAVEFPSTGPRVDKVYVQVVDRVVIHFHPTESQADRGNFKPLLLIQKGARRYTEPHLSAEQKTL